jgi:hypothetical protein
MNYQKIYDSLIAKRKENKPAGYTEKHHILPRALGGSDDPSNLVVLTGREHWIAHLLLWKINPCMQTSCAVMNMSRMKDKRGITKVKNSRMYQIVREAASKEIGKFNSNLNKGSNNPFFGMHWISSDELKISKRVDKEHKMTVGWFKGRKYHGMRPRIRKTRVCKGCGSTFFSYGSRTHCSRECVRVNTVPKWKIHFEGILKSYKRHGVLSKAFKEYGVGINSNLFNDFRKFAGLV